MIEAYARQICESLGGIRPRAKEERLRELHSKKDFVGMVRHVRRALRLDLGLRIGFVKSGGPPQAPAWIDLPNPMPFYGSTAFRETTVTMYIRKTFLEEESFEAVVIAIAHELSHVVLNATGNANAFENQEEAVDLTAMILGYRNFFRIGCKLEKPIELPRSQSFFQGLFQFFDHALRNSETYELGYLTIEEINFAADLMDRLSAQK